MQWELYLYLGKICCGPFPLTLEEGEGVAPRVAGLIAELSLPERTCWVLVEPGQAPRWPEGSEPSCYFRPDFPLPPSR
ncbi:hypothetical protein ACKC5O_17200 [Aeromonas schubertii]|uniref:Uncharacterized protein n=1 Tax=Aeromonas schubertii TaxID=652 RepID=A0ABS7VFW2_9GAMM|nr:hypothetical protein [Aeromonas schubertii]MBZ6068289.1 hypothetical protein [Aeromonas schubertii]